MTKSPEPLDPGIIVERRYELKKVGATEELTFKVYAPVRNSKINFVCRLEKSLGTVVTVRPIPGFDELQALQNAISVLRIFIDQSIYEHSGYLFLDGLPAQVGL